MKERFDKQAQLLFGAQIGALLRDTCDKHELTQQDMVALLLAVAAGWSIDARMSRESCRQLFIQTYDATVRARFGIPITIIGAKQ